MEIHVCKCLSFLCLGEVTNFGVLFQASFLILSVMRFRHGSVSPLFELLRPAERFV